jgi:hypothetical protein
MGYTHYWYLNKQAEHGVKFSRTLDEMEKIIADQRGILAGWDGEGDPKASFNGSSNGFDEISFNGQGEDSYESFVFRRFGKDKGSRVESYRNKGKDFGCCKTAHRPYDFVVVACLAVAAQVIGDGIEVHSDGDPDEWADGVALASRVLGRDVPVPSLER